MGSFATAGAWIAAHSATIAAGAAAAGAAAGTYESYSAGQDAKAEDKIKATQAGLEAGQKQIDLRQNMLRALASQNVAAGAGGIGTGGSFGANVNRQITQNQSDLAVTRENGAVQSGLLTQAGNNAAASGTIAAVKNGASIFDGLSSS